MKFNYIFISVYLVCQICSAVAQRCEVVVPLGMEDRINGIKDSDITASSSYSKDTKPYYGRLFQSLGAGAWVSNLQDNQQYLQIRLGGRRVITQISTQGRRGSKEIVTQYFVDFSDDPGGINWLRYLDQYGQSNYFSASEIDDNFVSDNFLQYPVVAQHIRIRPQRWIKLISLRLELYGCNYDNQNWGISFDGRSRLEYQMDKQGMQLQTLNDTIMFRLRTKATNGLILYASSTLGDYLSIEIWRAQLRININLGSTPNSMPGDNSLLAGSMLDDGRWHDIRLVRNALIINVSVDRAQVWTDVIGEFYHFDINTNISVGGLQSFPGVRGVTATQNFTGCMENLYFNELNMFRDYQAQAQSIAANDLTGFYTGSIARYTLYGNPSTSCVMTDSSTQIPITFQTGQDFIQVDAKESTTLDVTFQFRTFQKGGILLYTQISGTLGYLDVELSADGFIHYEVYTADSGSYMLKDDIQNMDPTSPVTHFADGLWHTLSITLSTNKANVTIDNYARVTTQSNFNIRSSKTYYLGGNRPGYISFKGCMRTIIVAGVYIDPTTYSSSMTVGTCLVRDRCSPNPCEHNGVCSQDWDTFYCDCSMTGYAGGVCHISKYASSCEEVRQYNQLIEQVDTFVDLDGSGPLDPMFVTCYFPRQYNESRTMVSHDAINLTTVDNYMEPGSYRKVLQYSQGSSLYNLQNLVLRAPYCRQYISYRCQNAKLLLNPAQVSCQAYQPNCYQKSYGWWVGRSGLPNNYWGGSAPGTGRCSCGTRNNCQGASAISQTFIPCNCDAPWTTTDLTVWLVDDGYLEYKPDLPLIEIRLGDTGTATDNKKSQYQIGQLECFGDNWFNQSVTFRRTDANIEFVPFYTGVSFDIKFQFRTTNPKATFLQAIGPEDFIEIRLREGFKVQFRFSAGYGLQVLEKFTNVLLNDNGWHTIQVERNRKQALLRVDNLEPVVINMMPDMQFRPFYLTSNLSIGSSVTFEDGFSGCMRAFTVNGVYYDLPAKVINKEYTYGLSVGCVEKCQPNPCLNRGECYEYYDHYYCECGRTAQRGYICGREVGVNILSSQMIKYAFDDTGANIGTVDEYIKVGFVTIKKQGILLSIMNRPKEEYITLFVNNNGGVTVEFNFGSGRYEVSTNNEGVDFANQQQHTAYVWREKLGRIVYIKVDDYPANSIDLTTLLSESSDTRIDTPLYLYMGKNETTPSGQGFQGCLFDAQFNNMFPVRLAFKDPPDPRVTLSPNPDDFIQDKCAVEELLPPREELEVRPMPTIPSDLAVLNRLPPETGVAMAVIIACVVGVLIVVIFVVLFFLCRYFQIDTGVYETNEEKGTEMAENADRAVQLGGDIQGQAPPPESEVLI